MKKTLILFTSVLGGIHLYSQQSDSIQNKWYSIHAQATIVNQQKPSFSAKYSGQNSLLTKGEGETSITSTLFLGAKLWKGASIFVNPEIAGGSGLSQALGVAASTNGETFRVGSAEPKIYPARMFFRQIFSLSKESSYQPDDFNQVAGYVPNKYFAVTVGKIGVADYFDDNKYSHDPRTQFLSWGLMDNGAWDYPANTRGYTPSLVLEYVTPRNEIRYAFSLVPKEANGSNMNWNISRANSSTLEYTHRYTLNNREGAFRIAAFLETANMGNYRQSIESDPENPDITQTRKYGRTKYGFTINAEQEITNDLGGFFRAGWNDGHNETWAFTEIDRTISLGLSLAGKRWKREDDTVGIAYVVSGISEDHRDYLKAGGMGFMLGDGNLNYGWENLIETYYSAELIKKHLFLTGTYQFLLNPGYNIDRKGPVNIFSIRVHMEI